MNQSQDNVNPPKTKRVRFVILHHHQDGGEQQDHQFQNQQLVEHWDFMVEQGESLATWQLFKDPTINPTAKIEARRIADHRKAYLEYEGPVSHGRGVVKRIESGTCVARESTPANWIIELEGKKLIGQYELRSTSDDQWIWHPESKK